MASRYCKVCRQFHDLDEDWPEECYGHFKSYRQSASIHIIKDIEPYKAAGADIASAGKRPVINSRSEHRDYLKRNKYIEIGNEKPKQRAWDYGNEISPRDVRQTIDQLRSTRER